jgi:lipopolysaccharide transport system permease protein
MPRNNEWDLLIKPRRKWLDLNLKELIKYKDLLLLFVRKDIVTIYKHTSSLSSLHHYGV